MGWSWLGKWDEKKVAVASTCPQLHGSERYCCRSRLLHLEYRYPASGSRSWSCQIVTRAGQDVAGFDGYSRETRTFLRKQCLRFEEQTVSAMRVTNLFAPDDTSIVSKMMGTQAAAIVSIDQFYLRRVRMLTGSFLGLSIACLQETFQPIQGVDRILSRVTHIFFRAYISLVPLVVECHE